MRTTVILSSIFMLLLGSIGAYGLTGSADSPTGPIETVSPWLNAVSTLTENSLSAVFSEPMHAPSMIPGACEVSGPGMGSLDPNPSTVTGTGPYTLSWSPGEMLNHKSVMLTISGVQDAVGNPIDPVSNSGSTLGIGIPPTFSNLTAVPSRVAEGDTVTILFSVSEPIDGNPLVTVNGHDATRSAGKDVDYSYTYTVSASDPLGMAAVAIYGEDLAGNSASLSSDGLFDIVDALASAPLHTWPTAVALLVAGVAVAAWRRKRLAVLLLVAALLASSSAMADGPVVSNVTFAQNPNETSTQVDIYYDLVSPNGPCTILLSLSKDGGTDAFPFPIRHYSGDSENVQTGTGKHIVWDIRADFPELDIPQARVRLTADDSLVQHTLTYSAGSHGSLTGATTQIVNHGANGSPMTAVPDEHYHFTGWSDGVLPPERTDTTIMADLSVTASFAIDTYSVTCNTVGSGTCAAAPATVDHGATAEVTVTPTEGWHIVSIEDSEEGAKSGSYTTTPVTANRTVTATFAINTYQITFVTAGPGVCSASPATVAYGGTSDITITPDTGCHIASIVDSVEGAKSGSYTTTPITADRTINVAFAINTYTLTYTAGTGGTLDGTLSQTVNYGASGSTVTATASSGFMFGQWSDGLTSAARTDSNVMADISVTVQFLPPPVVTSFAINSGADTAMWLQVNLNNVTTNAPTEYMASAYPDFAGESWQPYAKAPLKWLALGVGTRTIYFKARNGAGESNVMQDDIFALQSTVPVVGGTFMMGRTASGDDTSGDTDEDPAHSVALSPYQIGWAETKGYEYCDILNWAKAKGYLYTDATGTTPWAGAGDIYAGAAAGARYLIVGFSSPDCNIIYTDGRFSPWKGRDGLPAGTTYWMWTHPMVQVTWYGCVAYCNWLTEWQNLATSSTMAQCYNMGAPDWPLTVAPPAAGGYRLPTEAEWERAAAWDGTKHWIYGYSSDTLTGRNRANYHVTAPDYVNPLGLTTMPYTSPGGWFNGSNISPNGNVQTLDSKSPVGAYDMSGNVCEWCQDWYSATYYQGGPMSNPTGPSTMSGFRVLRGGSWNSNALDCRTARRLRLAPTATDYGLGFRIARTTDTQYNLTYTAGTGGSITGAAAQTVPLGGAGTTVTAVPNTGHVFVQWSDGVLTPSRTDTYVTANIAVTASFGMIPVITYFSIFNAPSTEDARVTLNCWATGDPTHYMASESATFDGASWQPYIWNPTFTLSPGVGTRTVYMKVKNEYAVSEDPCPSASIFLAPSTVSVPWGTFTMGRTDAGDDWTYRVDNETPRHDVTLGAYLLGKGETTNKEYCDVLNRAKAQYLLKASNGADWVDMASGDLYAGGLGTRYLILGITQPECNIQYAADAFSPKTRTGLPGSTAYATGDHPVVDVTWFGAVAFCNWLSAMQGLTPAYDMNAANWPLTTPPRTAGGYRLPTEAEWERAAAWDGTKHWIYGYTSDSLSGANRCNYLLAAPSIYVNPLGLTALPFTCPVLWFDGTNVSPNGGTTTTNSRSPVGAYGMSGNAVEWCQDWYDVYSGSAAICPTGPASGTGRVYRGGHWACEARWCRTAVRDSKPAFSTDYAFGFRVARTYSNQYVLRYTAGAHGSLSGTLLQIATFGGGTAVTAIPNSGYGFVNWSDGSTANPRTDANVTADINVTANFLKTPVFSYFAINNGAATTKSLWVTLNNTASESPTQYMASESASFTGASWQAYSTFPAFRLSAGTGGTKTVYFKARNAGGESDVVSDTIALREQTIQLPGSVPLVLKWVPSGSYQMGRYSGEVDSSPEEDPRHPVTLSYGFWMGKYEVTQEQWLAVQDSWPGTAPSTNLGLGNTYPAYYVSWDDTKDFITKLNAHIVSSDQGPLTVRLPSEAEWEYACRAGTQTRFYWGDDSGYTQIGTYAWYSGNSNPGGSKAVGGKTANAFGLYDMSGNLWEWCEDDWHNSYTGAPTDGSAWIDSPRASSRVIRGGNWSDYARYCRSAFRYSGDPSYRHFYFGFRLAAVQ